MKKRKINPSSEYYVPLMKANEGKNLDWNKAVMAPDMPNLKPTSATVNLRMPISMIYELKMQANKQGVPYQSYMKMLLADALKTHA